MSDSFDWSPKKVHPEVDAVRPTRMPDTAREIRRTQNIWRHDRFSIDAVVLREEWNATNGSDDYISETPFVSFERPEAVAAFIYNRTTGNVLLVEQYRPPILKWEAVELGATPVAPLIETAAGMVKSPETIVECLIREVREETGHDIEYDPKTNLPRGVERIATFYSSPGGSSERVHLFYVEIASKDPQGTGGGNAKEGESIRLKPFQRDEFLQKLRDREFKDPKVIIGGFWFQTNKLQTLSSPRDKNVLLREFNVLDPNGRSTGKIVGYFQGDIGQARDIDVWGNSENTYFLMDRMFGRTLSARIRTLGAVRDAWNDIADDTIQKALHRQLIAGRELATGHVIVTTSGALASPPYNVKKIIHAAAVKVREGKDGVGWLDTDVDILKECVQRTLCECEELNKAAGLSINPRSWFRSRSSRTPYRSVLLPLYGAGDDVGLGLRPVCQALIATAVKHFTETADRSVEKVYFLAYTPLEQEICERIMTTHERLELVDRTRTGSAAGGSGSGVTPPSAPSGAPPGPATSSPSA
ncbi:MAG: NUDIX domain-containing protein [Hyphomicrobium sp.]|nr:NUDIX domain-containing protein [Hyphomicrobium sp.]